MYGQSVTTIKRTYNIVASLKLHEVIKNEFKSKLHVKLNELPEGKLFYASYIQVHINGYYIYTLMIL